MEQLPLRRAASHDSRTYTLRFRENAKGLAKRVELPTNHFVEVVSFVRADSAKREVEVWIETSLVCLMAHTGNAVRVSNLQEPWQGSRQSLI